jgi:hypothetical protein
MMISEWLERDKDISIVDLAGKLEQFVRQAAEEGECLHELEQKTLASVLLLGRRCVDLFLTLQGNGDVGETVQTQNERTLKRSDQPAERRIRTVFGEHSFFAYTYSQGAKRKIELRPIDARMSLPEGEYSYLLQEFSQYFCIEEAFQKAQQGIEKVLGQKLPVDSLERINRQLGEQAETFLEQLPKPPAKEEGELLVVTADGKGVPMIREDAESLPAFNASKRRGNRRVATLASVYSVDRYRRSEEEVVAALFREDRPTKGKDRPRPCHKHVVARFAREYEEGDETFVVSGTHEAFAWAGEQVEQRRRRKQSLLRLCDGQEDYPETSNGYLDEKHHDVIDILDILHVAIYVWLAAKAFCGGNQEQAEAFARERLLRILQGQVAGVILGLRQMATGRKLKGPALKDVTTACNYMEKNAYRMRYDEYLREGYPIATGVIEGACRHLVKDRMERSGMRWRLPGAESMLMLRAIHVSNHWDTFQAQRMQADLERLHPHRHLIQSYTPQAIAI